MATTTVPTTITPEAAELARHYGVERELEAVLEQGQRLLQSVREFHVAVEPGYETDGEDYLLVFADIDPSDSCEATFLEWYRWPFETFGLPVADRIRVTSTTYEFRVTVGLVGRAELPAKPAFAAPRASLEAQPALPRVMRL